MPKKAGLGTLPRLNRRKSAIFGWESSRGGPYLGNDCTDRPETSRVDARCVELSACQTASRSEHFYLMTIPKVSLSRLISHHAHYAGQFQSQWGDPQGRGYHLSIKHDKLQKTRSRAGESDNDFAQKCNFGW